MSEEVSQRDALPKKASTISFDLSKSAHGSDGVLDVENQQSMNEPKDLGTEVPIPQMLNGEKEVERRMPEQQAISFSYKATKAPKDTLLAVYKAGEYKAGLPLRLLMVQSFMAGVYIAMAGQLYLAVGGGVLGSALFPTGLIAVVLTSAELFTGDALVFIASYLGGKVSFYKLLRNWSVSWVMNFVGSLFWAYFLVYLTDALVDQDRLELIIHVALKKGTAPWWHIFLKGIGANFMVCIGVWQATCSEEVAGKVLGLWFPIAAFVMMGFDHAIANQFFIPLGMMYGADISISHLLFQALLPASLGNIVGGGILVGAVYWYVYDSMASNKRLLVGIREGLFSKSTRRFTSAHASMRRMIAGNHSDDGNPHDRNE